MADFSLPTVTDLWSNVVAFLKNRDLDLAKQLDPAKTTVTNPVTDMIRWNSANGFWEIYNGTTWGALAATYNINAFQLLGKTWAIPGAIGATTPSTGAFTTISATGQITSTLATGTAPFSITSTTVVPNLNAAQLNGATFAAPGAIGGTTPGSGAFTTLSASGVITSTVVTGTAPLTIASTTAVANLNSSLLLGGTWAAPGTLGSTTPNSGAFTTVSASGVITSTVATGSPPLSIASTTAVANLNASLLLGNTWAAPGAIGGTTAGSGAFTTVSATGAITSTLATGTAPMVIASTTKVANLNVDLLDGTDWSAPGAIGGTTPGSAAFTTVSASGVITSTVATGTAPLTVASTTKVVNLNVDQVDGADWLTFSNVQSIFIPGDQIKARSANGAKASAQTAGAANQPDIDYLPFDGATKTYAQFKVRMPKSWNQGTITAAFSWRRASGTAAANVIWGMRALAVRSGDSPVQNFGSDATVTAAAQTTLANFAISAATGACTPGGTAGSECLLFVEVFRDGANALDTLDAVDAWLSGVTIYYTATGLTDA